MEAITSYITSYINGVIDLFDDGWFSLIVLLILAVMLVAMFAWFYFEDLVFDKLFKKTNASIVKKFGLLFLYIVISLVVVFGIENFIEIIIWLFDTLIFDDI